MFRNYSVRGKIQKNVPILEKIFDSQIQKEFSQGSETVKAEQLV